MSGVPCPAPTLSPDEFLTVLEFEVLGSDMFEEANQHADVSPCPAPTLSPDEFLTVLEFEVLGSDTFEEANQHADA